MNERSLWRALGAAVLLVSAQPVLSHNGEHDAPRHGGVVVPHGAMHFEIAAQPQGRVMLYFSDHHGRPLPASSAAQVAVEIEHPGAPTEYVKMAIDPTGAAWSGKARPLRDASAIVHVGFVAAGTPALVDIPAGQLITAAAHGGSHGAHHHDD